MPLEIPSSLVELPVELVYHILDYLDEKTMFLSVRNVCIKLNAITDKYHRYQVNVTLVMKSTFMTLFDFIKIFLTIY